MRNLFYLILFIATLYGTCAHAQDTKIAEVLRIWNNTKHVELKEGLVYKWVTSPSYDTAHFFEPGTEEWELTLTVKKKVPPAPEPKPDLETIIDSGDQGKTKYVGAWTHATGQTWTNSFYGTTASYTYVVEASIEISFTGYAVEWYTEKRLNHGIAGVAFPCHNHGQESLIDLYKNSSANSNEKVFEHRGLGDGTHTIRIRMTGNKNPAATENNIIHDSIKVFTKQQ